MGGGLVGPLWGLFLAELASEVEIYERRSDPRQEPPGGGRSINITLCERGFSALDRLGLGGELRRLAIPARGRVMHHRSGETTVQPYGNHGEAIHSIARRDIHRVVLERAAEHSAITLHFGHECLGVDLEGPQVRFRQTETGREVEASGQTLFACDGAHSRVRREVLHRLRLDYSQSYVSQGYKELRLPARADGTYRLEQNAIHIWPRGRHMLIGFANRDGSFTLALHLPFSGDPSFASVEDAADLEKLFEDDFRDVLPFMPDLVEDFFNHPVTPMITVRCAPWSFGDKLLLLGDSCHAIVPSYGQGANCSFENCAQLHDLMAQHGADRATAFKAFEARCRPETDAIADLALEHFEELQILVGEEDFQLRKQVERYIEARHPERYHSLYSMISFTRMPYTEARRRDRAQRRLVDELLGQEGIARRLEAGAFDHRIDGFFAPDAVSRQVAVAPFSRGS